MKRTVIIGFLIVLLASVGIAAGIAAAAGNHTTQISECRLCHQFFSCFYDCRGAAGTAATTSWTEVTDLVLTNNPFDDYGVNTYADIFFYDGRENPVGLTRTILSPGDVDEIYICKTLYAGKLSVPLVGHMVVMTSNDYEPPASAAYLKDLLGAFPRSGSDPYYGQISAMSKTACQEIQPLLFMGIFQTEVDGPSCVEPVFVQATDDADGPFCDYYYSSK
ncbi:MAG: hypothetical protein M1497_14710 [Nitrospirae bacterium]|nr:hypothetical protein [Nitrospirota bacterium]